jgi:hypothetical protein
MKAAGRMTGWNAEFLARLVRADRKLLEPVRQRGEQGQADLMGIRVRQRTLTGCRNAS